MKSSSQNQNLEIDRKSEIIDRLTADWGGIDHPLWRHEAANKINLVIETLLCIIAMSAEDKKGTPEGAAALTALITLTGWDFDQFQENLSDVIEKVELMNSQMGGMQ